MGLQKYIDAMIEQKTKALHTVFPAMVLAVEDDMAKIQPLGMYVDENGKTQKQSILTRVPIARHVRHWELIKQDLEIVTKKINPRRRMNRSLIRILKRTT